MPLAKSMRSSTSRKKHSRELQCLSSGCAVAGGGIMPAGRVGRTPPNLHKKCWCGRLEGRVPMGPVPLSVEAWRDEATYTGRSPICLTPRRR